MSSRPELRKLLQPRLTSYVPHQPTPKQAAFLWLPHLEAFYGGGAAGGKSDALLMGALQYADVPGFAALVLRRSYKDLSLPGAIMDRAHQWLAPSDASWNGETYTWTFPSSATLTFGYLQHDVDIYRYQGAEFQYVAFDELAQFREFQFRYLFSRLRRLQGFPVPVRMRAASNPDGPGFEWVRQRYLVEGPSAGRPYIPARLDDNPHVDRDSYELALAQLDPITNLRLRDGDWSVRPCGDYFRRDWFPILESAPHDLDWRWVRYWDMASTQKHPGNDPDWTAGALVGLSGAGIWCVRDVARLRGTPYQVESLVAHTAKLDGRAVPIWIEQERGSAGAHLIDQYRRRVLLGHTVRGNLSTGKKEVRIGALSAHAQAGNVLLVQAPWLTPFLDEAESWPSAPHDDQLDALAGAMQVLTKTPTSRAGVTGAIHRPTGADRGTHPGPAPAASLASPRFTYPLPTS